MKTTEEGVNKVKAGGFALVHEVPALNAFIDHVNTEVAPNVLLSTFYAFGTQQGKKIPLCLMNVALILSIVFSRFISARYPFICT